MKYPRKLILQYCIAIANVLFLPILGIVYFSFSGGLQSYNWNETTCRILSARLTRNLGAQQSDVAVEVEYHAGMQSVRTNALVAGVATQDNSAGELYYPGILTRCFISPSKQSDVMIGRAPEKDLQILLLVILLAPALGFEGIWRIRTLSRRHEPSDSDATSQDQKGGSPQFVTIVLVLALWTILVVLNTERLGAYWAEAHSSQWTKQTCALVAKPSVTFKDSTVGFVYSYAVFGDSYRSKDLTSYGLATVPADVLARLRSLQLGDEIDCYVSAENPLFAKLVVLPRAVNLTLLLEHNCAIIVIGVLFIWWSSRKFSGQQR